MTPTPEVVKLIDAFLILFPKTADGPGRSVLVDHKLGDADVRDALALTEVVKLQRANLHPFKDEGIDAALSANWYTGATDEDIVAAHRFLLLVMGMPEAKRWA